MKNVNTGKSPGLDIFEAVKCNDNRSKVIEGNEILNKDLIIRS